MIKRQRVSPPRAKSENAADLCELRVRQTHAKRLVRSRRLFFSSNGSRFYHHENTTI